MEYAKVLNGGVINALDRKPQWTLDGGIPVSDEWLIENEGIYPVEDNYIGNDRYIAKPFTEWLVETDRVVKTYWFITDETVIVDNPILKKIVLKPMDEWIWTDDEVTKTYTIEDTTDNDIERVLSSHSLNENGFDIDKHVLKPNREWLFNSDTRVILKTYWVIIGEPDTIVYPDAFYVHQVKDIEFWIKTDTTIEQVFDSLPYSLGDAKVNVLDYSSLRRWQIETGGFIWNGNKFHTDRESQMKLSSAYTLAKNGDIIDDMEWKSMDGFVKLTPTQIIELSLSVSLFVSDLYSKESVLVGQINGSVSLEGLRELYDGIDTSLSNTNSVVLSGD